MIVYLIRNTVTGKCYVGQTRRTLDQRFYSHKQVVGKSNACKALSDAMLKHGVENFTIELLQSCGSQDEMDACEVRLIRELKTFAPAGYNLTLGGGGKSGYKHSAESIEKRSLHFRGKKLTDDHKAKIVAALIGNKYALGLKHTDETKRLISEKGLGKKRPPFSESHRAGIAAGHRGMKASDETRAKMSVSQMLRNEKRRALAQVAS